MPQNNSYRLGNHSQTKSSTKTCNSLNLFVVITAKKNDSLAMYLTSWGEGWKPVTVYMGYQKKIHLFNMVNWTSWPHLNLNKKFWEEVLAYFPFTRNWVFDARAHTNTASNCSNAVARVLIAAETCLPSCCLVTGLEGTQPYRIHKPFIF
jgi:hypothetical protein